MTRIVPLSLLALTLGLTSPASAQGPRSSAPDTLEDGPHVYWESPTRIWVAYRCEEQFFKQALELEGAVRFRGVCSDSDQRYELNPRPPRPEEAVYDDGEPVFAVSDIHGEYDALVELLANAGVLDRQRRWSWGRGHLVILGDIFDRGDRVTECLWLVHRLEREAREAGGRVHYLLGNHELMVLQGDLRYVNEKYTEGVVRTTGIRYQDLFGPDMELGRWLRTKPVAIRLNGVLFVHGGMGPGVVERDLSIAEINRAAREGIDLPTYGFAFNDMPGFLYGSLGPFWYRGYHQSHERYPEATTEEVRSILSHFGASAVVVGHTERDYLERLHGGLVYGIDVPLEDLGSFQGLLWEDGAFYRVLGNGERQPLG